jgi:hypothetical protein
VAAFPERDYFSVRLASLGDLGIEARTVFFSPFAENPSRVCNFDIPRRKTMEYAFNMKIK